MKIKTRLVIEIPETLRSDIKIRAAQKKITLKNWVLLAIAKMIQEENDEQGLS